MGWVAATAFVFCLIQSHQISVCVVRAHLGGCGRWTGVHACAFHIHACPQYVEGASVGSGVHAVPLNPVTG